MQNHPVDMEKVNEHFEENIKDLYDRVKELLTIKIEQIELEIRQLKDDDDYFENFNELDNQKEEIKTELLEFSFKKSGKKSGKKYGKKS